MTSQAGKPHRSRFASAAPLLLAAAFLLILHGATAASEVSPEPLVAALLTRDLGDPRAPGNAKLVLELPANLRENGAAAIADDFEIYVYPAGFSRERGVIERYRAHGVYLWHNQGKIFLDARILPRQDDDGPATVRVVYAPGGQPLAEGEAEGSSRFGSELADVVLAVDVSLSMNYNDPRKRRVTAARSFIEMARKGGGIGSVGLITFNHFATRRTPLLPLAEGEKLLTALNKVGAEGLTSLDAPIELGMMDLEGSRRPVIILMSDGKNEGSTYAETHLRAARDGVKIYTVGLSEEADHELLREMADATGGIYFRAVKDSDLPEIYARIAAELGKRQLLQAIPLPADKGKTALPVDATVKRLVAMADGGARVRLDGPASRMPVSGGMAGVHVVVPDPGEWQFTWDRATPDLSTLALFGDTQLYMDVFPPQLRGSRLFVGATLAEGARPLAGSEVWVEPVPGILPRRLRLYDDGQHGDGAAGDGVYGASIDLAMQPEQLNLIFRAAGAAWDKGDFVRQAAGLAIATHSPARARLDGDIDFGILFPGETGSAVATLDLEALAPSDLYLELIWDAGDEAWPDLSSMLAVDPGRSVFELEMTVPTHATPGYYRGRFEVGDGADLADSSEARVQVGSISFDGPGAVDLGVVPPGTFANQLLRVRYRADKGAPLKVSAEGANLKLAGTPAALDAGEGELILDITARAPIGTAEGDHAGRVILRAGPGMLEIPVSWQVRALVARASRVEPPPGLPQAPSLPGQVKPLERSTGLGGDLLMPDQPVHDGQPQGVISPWERTSSIFRDKSFSRSDDASLPDGGTRFSDLAPPASQAARKQADSDDGKSFWSGWWIYLLAALLLLLLLLLLLAYILYRLGKSHVARFLLASSVANIAMIIAFLLLLGSTFREAGRAGPVITVNLVDEEPLPAATLSEAEMAMMEAAGASGSSADTGGAGSLAGEISFADVSAAGGQSPLEKTAELPQGVGEGASLADAGQAAAVPLENRRQDGPRRRERHTTRSSEPVPMQNAPELAEMSEPPPESGEPGVHHEVGEAALELEAVIADARPVWSDGERIVQTLARDQGQLLAEPAGMEAVSMDDTMHRLNPRGQRRTTRDLPQSYPEPRAEIDDPIRNLLEIQTPATREDLQADPGVEEVRIDPRVVSMAPTGRRPGVLLPPGASHLNESLSESAVTSVSGAERVERAAPRGGPRTTRGGASRRGSSLSSPDGSLPGGSSRQAERGEEGGTNARGHGGEIGEERFDTGDGRDGLPASSGAARNPAAIGGGGASPNPFDGGGGDRVEYAPSRGAAGHGGGDGRDHRRRGDRGGNGDTPGRTDNLPGGGTGASRTDGPGGRRPGVETGPGAGRMDGGDSGRGISADGLGESRFDDMMHGSGGSGDDSRQGTSIPELGRSRLGGTGGKDGHGLMRFDSSQTGWKRNDRRERRRENSVVSSSLDMESLVIVVGDFARSPNSRNAFDPATENLFGALSRRLGGGLAMDERLLSPSDLNLNDCLLALATPDAIGSWSASDMAKVAGYLQNGGHIWVDAGQSDADDAMRSLARAAGGEYGPLVGHQLSDGEQVSGVMIGDVLAAVATGRNWRSGWRRGDEDDGATLRFLTRTLNFFLSKDAESGIVLVPEKSTDELQIQPYSGSMPERLAGGPVPRGRLWDDFADGTASWRIPSWSDRADLSAASDGRGGRAIRIDMGGAVKGRTAAYRTLNPPEDFSKVGRVTLEAYYDGVGEATASMVFTVRSAGEWLDFETPAASLVPGWNRLEFEVTRNNFRSLSGGGVVNALPGTDSMGRAGFFIYRAGSSPAVVIFRDIRLHGEAY